MKIIDIRFELLYNHDSLHIMLEKGQYKLIQPLLDEVGTIDPSKDYEVKIKPKSKKRSNDANSYMWTLLNQLANKLNTSDIELYRLYVKNYGVKTIMPIKNEAVNKFTEAWKRNGIGWFTDTLGSSKIEGYTNIIAYYGSSSYDTKEMSRLLDQVVTDCEEQGIEILTPDELTRLKTLWGDKNG